MVTEDCYPCLDRMILNVLDRPVALECQSVIGRLFALVVKNRALFKI